MNCLDEFYSCAWLERSGKKFTEQELIDSSIDDLYKTQWNSQFEKLMRNRLVMGAMRYGDIRYSKGWDYIDYLKKKLKIYEETGNTEMLVDVANLALLEFMNGDHPKKHFTAIETNIHNVRKKE